MENASEIKRLRSLKSAWETRLRAGNMLPQQETLLRENLQAIKRLLDDVDAAEEIKGRLVELAALKDRFASLRRQGRLDERTLKKIERKMDELSR